MANKRSAPITIRSKPAYRAVPITLLKQLISDTVVEQVEEYVAPHIPEHWGAQCHELDSFSSHSQFALNEPSMFSDGSFPIGYFCSTVSGALDEFGERVIDLIVYGAGNGRAMMEVAVIEVFISGQLLDISGDKEGDFLDPMEDWQAFGKLVRADESLDGLVFSGSVYERNDPLWYASFRPTTITPSCTLPKLYQLTWDGGEFTGYEAKHSD